MSRTLFSFEIKKVEKGIKIGEKAYKVYVDCKEGKLLRVEDKNQNIVTKIALSNKTVRQLVQDVGANPQE